MTVRNEISKMTDEQLHVHLATWRQELISVKNPMVISSRKQRIALAEAEHNRRQKNGKNTVRRTVCKHYTVRGRVRQVLSLKKITAKLVKKDRVLLGRIYKLTPSGKFYATKTPKEKEADEKWFADIREKLASIDAVLETGGSLLSGDEPSNLYAIRAS